MVKKKTTKKSAKKSTTKKTNKKNGFWVSNFKFLIKWGLVVGLWCAIILTGILLWYASELPTITKTMVFERRPTIIIKAQNGDVVDRYGDVKGEIVNVENLPPHITNAVMAIEDRRFYDHFGMDIKGIARAFFVNIKKGGFVQGGSTITQQLAKNLFLSRERTLKRKIQELMLAFQLERELTKDEILSAYLNRVYLGSGAYGVDAASKVYFNKSAHEINIREAATIAGLLKAPSRYSPSASPERAAARTKVVLKAMVDAGYVEQLEIDKYMDVPPAPRRKPSSGKSVRYYTDYIVSQLDDLIGNVDSDIIVTTTLNQTIQDELESSITKAVLRYGEDRNVEQGAGVFIRLDGAVVALAGGKNYSRSEFNRVTHSLRPPGSSFKPIVYLTALENGWDINSIIADEPITEGRYRPKNFGHEYFGEITLFEALTRSLNTVAVNLMRDVGAESVIAMAQRLGITANLQPNLSTALGSSGVPMMQMVTAYATLGRGGLAVEPYSIKKIENKEGEILYQRSPPKQTRQVVETGEVIQITAMMQSVIQNGTGQAASIPYPSAGKTGTSQDFRDAWFIGFSSKYAGAVWFGNDDNSPTKRLTGGSAPAQVWRDVMTQAQRQGGKTYNHFSDITFSEGKTNDFDKLLSSILNNSLESNKPDSIWGWLTNGKIRQRNQNENTQRNRNQWKVNE